MPVGVCSPSFGRHVSAEWVYTGVCDQHGCIVTWVHVGVCGHVSAWVHGGYVVSMDAWMHAGECDQCECMDACWCVLTKLRAPCEC